MKKTATTDSFLIIVRHGQTDFNLERRFQGQLDVPLNALGKEQAHRSAEAIKKLLLTLPEGHLKNIQFLSSDLPRAAMTSKIVHSHLREWFPPGPKMSFTPALREQHVGSIQGLTMDEFRSRLPKEAADYEASLKANPYVAKPPGKEAESKMDIAHRLRELIHDTVIPSHENKQPHVHIWCSHGWVINTLVDLISATYGQPEQYIGNADVLLIKHDPSDRKHSELGLTLEMPYRWKIEQHIVVGERIEGISLFQKSA